MSANHNLDKSFSLESYKQSKKHHSKPCVTLYNIHPNLKYFRSSLADSFKATQICNDDPRKFLVSGNKMKRALHTKAASIAKFKDPPKIGQKDPIPEITQKDPIPIKLVDKKSSFEPLQVGNNIEMPIKEQQFDNKQQNEIEQNFDKNEKQLKKPPSIGQNNKKNSLFMPDPYPTISQNPIRSLQHLNQSRISQEVIPSIIENKDFEIKSIAMHGSFNPKSSFQLLEWGKSNQSLKQKTETLLASNPLIHEKTEVLITSHSRDSNDYFGTKKMEFYELPGRNFKNYKYKKYDRELMTDSRSAFGHNLKNKLPLIGARWFPSIERLIEQNSQKTETNHANTFEKLREEYFSWKQNLIVSRGKSREPQIEEISSGLLRKNQAKTPNINLKLRENIYKNKPKTSDTLLKTVLINHLNDWEQRERDRTSSIHENKEGDIINCGFKRTFSNKFNVVYQEFQKMIEMQRGMRKGFEIVGLRKEIETVEIVEKNKNAEKNLKNIEKNLKNMEKQQHKILEGGNEFVNFEILSKNFKFLGKMHEKLRKRVFEALGVNNSDFNMDFNDFMRFHEVFLQKPLNGEKIVEFLIEFLKPKENSVQNFLKNVKKLLKNIKDVQKKQETYTYLLDIFTKNGVITKDPETLSFSLLQNIFLDNKLNPFEILYLITSL